MAAHTFTVLFLASMQQMFPSSLFVLVTRALISVYDHINTEGLLFRSWCQHATGKPVSSSSLQHAKGLQRR